jgi:hypothetical protein
MGQAPNTFRLTADLGPEYYEPLRLYAFLNRQTMTSVVRGLIELLDNPTTQRKLAKLRTGAIPPPEPQAGPTRRITVDLRPEHDQPLRLYAYEHRLTITEVIRELIVLLDDPAIQRQLPRRT